MGGGGVGEMLTLADKGGRGGLDPLFLADIMCEQPLNRPGVFERMFTPHHVSHVTCHVSCVTCHMSHVMCNFSFLDKTVEPVGGGSVINGAYPV